MSINEEDKTPFTKNKMLKEVNTMTKFNNKEKTQGADKVGNEVDKEEVHNEGKQNNSDVEMIEKKRDIAAKIIDATSVARKVNLHKNVELRK